MIQNLSQTNFDYLKKRNVNEILHFTDIENLESIFLNGILPRNVLDQKNISYISNDELRLDGKSHINLSISNLNTNMFYKFRKDYKDRRYIIFSLDPTLIKEMNSSDYYFTSENAASNKSQIVSVEELFTGFRGNLPTNCPTNNQSELIIKTTIPTKYINVIYVENDFDHATVQKVFPTIKVIRTNKKFDYKKFLVDLNTHEKLAETLDFDEALSKILDEIKNHKMRQHSLGISDIDTINNDENRKIDNLLNELYLTNWFATEKQMKQTQELYKTNKITAVFDTYALSKKHFEDKHYDKSTDIKEKFWKIQYNPVNSFENEYRTPNQLSALAVFEKIINRGRFTTLSPSLEAKIQSLLKDENSYTTIRYAHQIQSTLVELIKVQKLKKNDIISIDNLNSSIARAVFNDLKTLDSHISKMYNIDPFLDNIQLSQKNSSLTLSNLKQGEDIVSIIPCKKPIDFIRDFVRIQESVNVTIEDRTLRYLLKYIFGFSHFRPNQIDGIKRTLNHQDSIVLLPTGSGKSIVYQLLSLITPGISFIVDPIVSLAYDQVDNLYRKGIDRVTELVSDTENREQVEMDIGRGQYFMNFVSPERFQNKKFRDRLQYYARTNIISLIAIDEAHCVSEWGHDFRTSYLSLAQTCRTICTTPDRNPPPLIALTGTASASVLRDMQRDLKILDYDAIIQPKSFDRKEIEFRVVNCKSNEKEKVLNDIIVKELPRHFNQSFDDFYALKNEQTSSGLVFCPFAGNNFNYGKYHPFGTISIRNLLNSWLPENKCEAYNGQLSSKIKKDNARKFKNNELIALAATKSYGMGIDKPNIRWAVHYGISSSIESYYQEAGRCARDGKPGVSWIILSNDKPSDNLKLLDSMKTPINELKRINDQKKSQNDDVSRVVFFHTNSFSGIEKELHTTNSVLNFLLDNRNTIPFDEKNKSSLEKAIFRLKIIGFVSDYTMNHQNKTINVLLNTFSTSTIEINYREYISGYQEDDGYLNSQIKLLKKSTAGLEHSPKEYLLTTIKTLLEEFTYKIVEEGRRIAMRNMLVFTTEASQINDPKESGEHLRKKIVDYLSVSDAINSLDFTVKGTDLEELNSLFSSIKSKRAASRTTSQISRLLEAYPENFGLYYILLKIQIKYFKKQDAMRILNLALQYGRSSYDMKKDFLFTQVVSLLCKEDLDAPEWNQLLQIVNNELGTAYVNKLVETYENDTLKKVYLTNKLSLLSNKLIKELNRS
ncbi:RecQ family ATP-dependent DNA helicase [Exiguobacterium acetylicum]|uniref:RecQ family ATP-dependent DNA helicase n=1 Tax=Exiguobacterium acetylicum TaxID=41170 RepID=UPI0039779833